MFLLLRFNRLRLLLPACLMLVMFSGESVQALQLQRYPDITSFLHSFAKRNKFSEAALRQLFSKVVLRPELVSAMQKPAEGMAWERYRKIFVNSANLKRGHRFTVKYARTLQRAEKKYGVDRYIIAAIIGVETRFGQHLGKNRTLDALTTLAFLYPRRSRFFRSELEHFLLLTQEQKLDPLQLRGSYAGAIGIPQFMPSSYRKYAVDLDGDGKRNLMQYADAIGSVAHYLQVHGWQQGKNVAVPAVLTSSATTQKWLARKLKTVTTVAILQRSGIRGIKNERPDRLVGLVELVSGNRKEYRLAFENFFVITRYNRSWLYAAAVTDLAQALRFNSLHSAKKPG